MLLISRNEASTISTVRIGLSSCDPVAVDVYCCAFGYASQGWFRTFEMLKRISGSTSRHPSMRSIASREMAHFGLEIRPARESETQPCPRDRAV